MNVNQYLSGYVEIMVQCQGVEQLINAALYRGLKLWDINRIDQQTLSIKVPLHNIWPFIQLVRQHKGNLKIITRHGLPFIMSKLKRRKGLLLGSCLFFALVYLSLSFVWSYDIIGNERFSDQQMIGIVQKHGIIPGKSLRNIDYDQIQEDILIEYDDLSFIKITPKGTKIEVKVQEKDQINTEDQRPAHLIANRDGVIKQLLVFKGTAQVALEQQVQTGDILIQGLEYLERVKNEEGIYEASGDGQWIRAKGIVYGEIQYTAVGLCHLNETALTLTGQEKSHIAIETPQKKWVILGSKKPAYTNCQQIIDTKTVWRWKDYISPICLVTTTFKEQVPVHYQYTLEEAYYQSIERARQKLNQKVTLDSKLIDEKIKLVSQPNNQLVQVEVTWTVEENMASPQLITINSSR